MNREINNHSLDKANIISNQIISISENGLDKETRIGLEKLILDKGLDKDGEWTVPTNYLKEIIPFCDQYIEVNKPLRLIPLITTVISLISLILALFRGSELLYVLLLLCLSVCIILSIMYYFLFGRMHFSRGKGKQVLLLKRHIELEILSRYSIEKE